MPLQTKTNPHGFSLLETLVALLVLSLGLLGLAGLQLINLKNSRDAYHQTQALILAQDITERMRANRQGSVAGAYLTQGTQHANCRTEAGCTAAQLAADDVFLWRTAVQTQLPSGEAVVCLDSSPDDGTDADTPACDNSGQAYVSKIWWDDDRNPASAQQRLRLVFIP